MAEIEAQPSRRTGGSRRGTRLEVAFRPAELQTLQHVAALTGEPALAAVVSGTLKVYIWILTQQHNNRRIIAEDLQGSERVELMPVLKVTAPALPDTARRGPEEWSS